jgi:hypothetical protein
MSDVPVDLRFSHDLLWTRFDSGTGVVRVGATVVAQQALNRRFAGLMAAPACRHLAGA